jgi:hypothetical protein
MIHESEVYAMSRKNLPSKWPWIAAVVLMVVGSLTALTFAQEGSRLADPRDSLHVPMLTFGPQGSAELPGLPDDWSHHHLIFSNPGTEQDAIQKGTYDDWLRIVNDPRYIMQQLKRRSPAQGPAAEYVASMNEMPRAQEAALSEELAAPQLDGPLLPVLPIPGRPPRAKIHRDWSMDLGNGGKVGAGQFPAKYAFSTSSASCSDYVAYPTGLAGSSSQATVVAYNNIYATTCSGSVPSIYWAYNTGGTAALSPVISGNGGQIAYIQTSSSNVASLVLLKMASSGGTASAPAAITSVANSGYYNYTAPCYTAITLDGSPNDTNSSPFYDYTNDIIYVGDNSGKLHKFTPVFNGTPAEVTTSGWPVTVSSNILTSPVYDSGTSQDIFVADSGGFLYSYTTASAAVMKSSQLAATGSKGIVDGPLVDSTTEMVYVFVGDDENTNTSGPGPRDCDNATGCNGVFQFAAGDTTNGTGVCTSSSATSWGTATNCGEESVFGVGNTSTVLYDGSFDQVYYSGAGTTGNLWSCGATGTPAPKLMYTTMSAFVPSAGDVIGIAANAINPLTGTGAGVGTAATCSPVTEIYGTAGTTDDYIFLSVTNDGNQTGTACSGAGAAGACLYNLVVSVSCTYPTCAATAGLATAGGSSGIIIDNISGSTGASQIYFSSLSNETCAGNGTTGGGTGSCAVQASQSAP